MVSVCLSLKLIRYGVDVPYGHYGATHHRRASTRRIVLRNISQSIVYDGSVTYLSSHILFKIYNRLIALFTTNIFKDHLPPDLGCREICKLFVFSNAGKKIITIMSYNDVTYVYISFFAYTCFISRFSD